MHFGTTIPWLFGKKITLALQAQKVCLKIVGEWQKNFQSITTEFGKCH